MSQVFLVMKLAAIYNSWDDWDLLTLSINNIRKLVDMIVVVNSFKSNYGEAAKCGSCSNLELGCPIFIVTCEPDGCQPMQSETKKRNHGLDWILECNHVRGITHFITMDSDEFYDPKQFLKAKEYVQKTDVAGLVVESHVYFRHPWLTIGKDVTLVPHIHRLTPSIRHEFNRNYPFAWINGQIRIDPTRSLSINSGVEMFDCPMHHMSWVRKDYKKKIRNSTARANLDRSTILQDLLHAKEGYFCKFYQKTLVRVPNLFGIPDYGEFLDENLCAVAPTDSKD